MSFTGPYIHTSAHSSFGKRQRAVVVIGPIGCIPERLKLGLERELPWTVQVEVESVATACRMFPDTVALILLHPSMVAAAEQSIATLRRFHPLALIGVIQLGPVASAKDRELVAESKIVQGLVPLSPKIHDFVAIVAFMLRGGQYFPRELLMIAAPSLGPALPLEPQNIEKSPAVSQLTPRELEILELVAQGLQNKSIAAQLHLSEFTVKIHLHNIITKLGAHNRTEAAAVLRNGHRPTLMSSHLS